MEDGLELRADVFRPSAPGRYPALLSYGPYGKGLAFQEGYKTAWEIMARENPDVLAGSSNRYQNWEVVDPEKWVPDGYVCIRFDSRGAGRSPGYLCHNGARETQDIVQCIAWAAQQPWCSGKVGMNGISYYASNQWRAAAARPPQLAAICVWEGWNDAYRESARHGGIICSFRKNWQEMQVKTVQHGFDSGKKNPVTAVPVCGDEVLPEAQLEKNRENMWQSFLSGELWNDYYAERSPDLSRVTIPLLTAANWGGQGLHTRGNFEGFVRSKAKDKWLEVHGGSHWAPFYTDYGLALQKRFFDHFLNGEKNGWQKQPRVLLNVRHPGEKFVQREENEWPLARTQWTRYHLNPATGELTTEVPSGVMTLTYATTGDGLMFSTPPLDHEIEITGPVAAKLAVSSATTDADLFLVLRVFDPEDHEVVFIGSNDPRVPVGLGWLRASHRKTDPKLSLPYRPWHTHDEERPLTPGTPVEVDVEILPTSIVVPKGYRLALSVRGKDYEYDGTDAALAHAPYPMKGVGPFTHTNAQDRPAEIFGGKNTLHFGGKHSCYLLLPVIPPKS